MEEKDNFDDNWKPLESNPEVINPFVKELGYDINQFQFQDLFSVEEWAQQAVPKPCIAVILLYPYKSSNDKFIKDEADAIIKNGQILSQKLFYMKQYAMNACGTIAVFHSILNNLSPERPQLLEKGSFLETFYQKTINMSPEDRGKFFQQSKQLKEHHEQAVEEGQSEVVEQTNTHFISFVQKEGYLYELDGMKQFPINHGKTNNDTFLSDACVQVKKFMDRDPNEVNFTLLTLANASEAEDQ